MANIDALKLAIAEAEAGEIVAFESGRFVSAHAGADGSLVQMYADGTFDVDGDPSEGGEIPADLQARVAALIQDLL